MTVGAGDEEELNRLELEKLRLEIAHLKKADFRDMLSSFTPIILGIGTAVIALSSLYLNKTIDDAADRQRAFENYTRLTDEFSKSGSAKLGAIVGFRAFLQPPSDRSQQTIELIANELLKERDAGARRAIVYDLIYAGLPAFGAVRDINVVTRERLKAAAIGVLIDGYYAKLPVPVRKTGTADLSALAAHVASDLRVAADQYDLSSAKEVRENRETALADLTSHDASVLSIQTELTSRELGRSSAKRPYYWVHLYDSQVPAFLASAEILRSLLKQPAPATKPLDASGIAVFDVDLRDANLEGADLRDSFFMMGIANGADLTNADLSDAVFFVDLHRSELRTTSLCGTTLAGTTLAFPLTYTQRAGARTQTANRQELPDLTAADWWDGAGIYDAIGFSPESLEVAFPRARNEPLTALPSPEKKRRCYGSTYVQKGSPTPEPMFVSHKFP